jgi:hypothetical protein
LTALIVRSANKIARKTDASRTTIKARVAVIVRLAAKVFKRNTKTKGVTAKVRTTIRVRIADKSVIKAKTAYAAGEAIVAVIVSGAEFVRWDT